MISAVALKPVSTTGTGSFEFTVVNEQSCRRRRLKFRFGLCRNWRRVMWKTLEIVPSSIRDDPQVIAACEAIDKELVAIYDETAAVPDGILFWPFVDQQFPPLLDILAWEMHVDVWAGWEADLDVETKRALINQSIDWHRHKGTRYAVDQMLRTVFKQGTVTEWYEYWGLPYFFRISFEGDITGTQWEQIKTAVFAVKNVRSWLDGFITNRLYLQTLWHGIVTNQWISTKINYTEITHPPSPTYDYDAFNFMVRAKITVSSQKAAINALVLTLKSGTLLAKMKAIYPFVGGTASAHRENLKLPDYQIAWSGLVLHNSKGITGLGGIGHTGLNVAMIFEMGSISFGVYDKTATAEDARQLSASETPGDYSIAARRMDDKAYGNAGLDTSSISATSTDAKGFWVVSRTQLTLTDFYRNATSLGLSPRRIR